MQHRTRHVCARLATAALVLSVLMTAAPGVRPLQASSGSGAPGWPMYRGGEARTGYSDSLLVPPFRQRWSVPLTVNKAYPPILAEGRIFVQAQKQYQGPWSLLALDPGTGKELWSRQTSKSGPSPAAVPVYLDGLVVTHNGTDAYVALDAATGEERWSFKTSKYVYGRPLAVGDRLYIPDGSATLALDRSGKELWRAKSRGSDAAYGDGRIYMNGSDPAALDPATGKVLWTTDRQAQVSASGIIYAEQTVLAFSTSRPDDIRKGKLWALDAGSGQIRWFMEGVGGTPAVWNGVVYVPRGDTSVARYRLQDGAYLGAIYPGPIPGLTEEPVIANGYLYLGALTAVSLATGEALQVYKTESHTRPAPSSVVVGDGLVLVSDGEALVALEPVQAPPVAGLLEGRVTAAGGQPVPGARIRLEGAPRAAAAGAGGRFTLQAAAGSYVAVVSAFGYRPLRTPVELAPGGTLQLEAVLEPAARGLLIGSVTDAVSGKPLAGATVTLPGDFAVPAVTTSGNGEFRLELYEGEYRLQVKAPGHHERVTQVTVAAAQESPVALALRPIHDLTAALGANAMGSLTNTGQGESIITPALKPVWQNDTLRFLPGVLPVVAGGRVFTVADDDEGVMLAALDLATGKPLWVNRYEEFSGPIRLLFYRETLYAVHENGFVFALDPADGRRLWAVQHGFRLATIAAEGDRIFLRVSDELIALDRETGATLWIIKDGGKPIPAGGVLYTYYGGLGAEAFDAATGKQLWFRPWCSPCEATTGFAMVAGGLLVQAAMEGQVQALDLATGQVVWSLQAGDRRSYAGWPVSLDGLLYIPTAKETLVVRLEDGSRLGTLPPVPYPVGVSGYLIGNDLSMIDLTTGKLIPAPQCDLSIVSVGDDMVVAIDRDQRLLAFRPAADGPVPGVIRGTVTGAGGVPLQGPAVVRVGGRKVTLAPGESAFAVRLRPGDYQVSVQSPRWLGAGTTVTLKAGGEAEVAIALEPQPKSRLRGIVYDGAGAPLAGARVSVMGETALAPIYTGDTGEYSFDLFPGRYILRVEAEGRQTAYELVSVAEQPETVRGVTLKPGADGGCYAQRCSADRSAVSPGSAQPPFTMAWSATDLFFIGHPIIARGMVYSATRDNRLVGLDLLTGRPVWSRTLDRPTMPVYGGGKLYAGHEGAVSAFDPDTGKLLWDYRYTKYSWTPSMPIYDGGRLYFGATGGGKPALYAVGGEKGELIWRQETAEGPEMIAVGGGRVYAVFRRTVAAFDGQTGAPLWQTANLSGTERGWSIRNITYADGTLLVTLPEGDKNLLALDAATGAERWRAGGQVPAVRNGVVYGNAYGWVVALDLKTGTQLWSVKTNAEGPIAQTMLWDHYLVVSGTVVVDIESHKVVWQFPSDDALYPVIGEGWLLLQLNRDELGAFRGITY